MENHSQQEYQAMEGIFGLQIKWINELNAVIKGGGALVYDEFKNSVTQGS